jgi:hypothetical protein
MDEQPWHTAVRAIRANPELYEAMLRSVISNMALAGLEADEARLRQSFEEALNGPALVYPGQDD